jgi:hypothetical protein
MFPPGLIRATASRTLVISGSAAAIKTLRQNDAGKCGAGGLPDFPRPVFPIPLVKFAR